VGREREKKIERRNEAERWVVEGRRKKDIQKETRDMKEIA
jgi:hypothetical protein